MISLFCLRFGASVWDANQRYNVPETWLQVTEQEITVINKKFLGMLFIEHYVCNHDSQDLLSCSYFSRTILLNHKVEEVRDSFNLFLLPEATCRFLFFSSHGILWGFFLFFQPRARNAVVNKNSLAFAWVMA